MTRFIVLATTALVGSAAAAVAGGYTAPVVEVAPVVAPVVADTDWTGFYLGAQLGKVDGTVGPDGRDVDVEGTSYGLHAGYLHDFGRFVGGAELSWDKLSGLEAEGGDADTDGSILRGKLLAGYDAGRFLPYATLGYADMTIDDVLGADRDGNGYFYGLGAKFLATDKIMVGGEILKHEFSDFDDMDGLDVEATTIGLNVSYKF